MADKETVHAAGGVVYRRTGDGVEVLVIHRPLYDDWTLPKGKLDPGESAEQAAVREVKEETGFDAVVEAPAGTARYHDRHGRPKEVTYWFMEAAPGAFAPNREVDQIRWLAPEDAVRLLSFERDRQLVEGLAGHAGL